MNAVDMLPAALVMASIAITVRAVFACVMDIVRWAKPTCCLDEPIQKDR